MNNAERLLGTDVTEHALPGIGRRYECATIDGGEVVVVLHHSGRRDLYVWDTGRDAPRAAVTLTDSQARTLGAVLSGAYLKPVLVDEVEAVIGELLIDWVTLRPDSPGVGRTIAELDIRRATRMYVAAIVRSDGPLVAPPPSETLRAGDRLVVVGRPGDLAGLVRHVVGRDG